MVGRALPLLISLLLSGLIFNPDSVQAQRRNTRQSSSPPPPSTPLNQTVTNENQNSASQSTSAMPDVAITANVTARELRFDVVPNPRVEFFGNPERITVWDAERQNLTRPVQPGVTYRNIGIQLKITSIFPDIDRIVAEALGERPINEGTTTTPTTPATNQASPPPTPPAPPAVNNERSRRRP